MPANVQGRDIELGKELLVQRYKSKVHIEKQKKKQVNLSIFPTLYLYIFRREKHTFILLPLIGMALIASTQGHCLKF